MPRLLITLLLVAATAVVLALAGLALDGNATFTFGRYRVEMAIAFFAVALIALFAVAYLLLRLVAYLISLPQRVRAHREQAAKARGREALIEALSYWVAGRPKDALASSEAALTVHDLLAVTALVRAQAAHSIGNHVVREQSMNTLASYTNQFSDPARLKLAAEFALADNQLDRAMSAISEALFRDSSNVQLLELRYQIEEARGEHSESRLSLEKIAQLASESTAVAGVSHQRLQRDRRNASYLAEIHELRQQPALEAAVRLKALVNGFKPVDRMQPALMQAAAQALIANGQPHAARELIEASLKDRWQSELLERYADCAITGEVLPLIARAERWLLEHPRDAELLTALSKLCQLQGLVGKSESYADASRAVRAH